MGTMQVLDAVRMLEIEASSIVDGEIDNNGHLILTTQGGDTIDAGDIRAPATMLEVASTALPAVYPHGTSQFAYAVTTGWPCTLGLVFTVMEGATRGFQFVTEKITGNIWIRTVNNNSWGSFFQLASTAHVAVQTARIDTLVNNVNGQELAGSVDLDTVITTGVYFQSQNSEAASGSHYPVPYAGILEVNTNSSGNMVWQRYRPYNVYQKTSYERTYYLSAGWSPWYARGAGEDRVLTTSFVTGWAAYGTPFPDPYLIRKGDLVIMPGTMFKRTVTTTLTVASATEVAVASAGAVPAGWAPGVLSTDMALAPGIVWNVSGGQNAAPSVFRVKGDGSITIVSYGTTQTFNATSHWITTPPLMWLAGQ